MNFTESLEILAMISSEKEEVFFTEKIYPANARGMVEKWLLEVEESMLRWVFNRRLLVSQSEKAILKS